MKTALGALALLSGAVVSSLVGQGNTKDSRQTLAGLTGVYVSVEVLTGDAQRNELWETQLRTDVELRLREAGVKVVAMEDIKSIPGLPYLYVGVGTLEIRSTPGLYALSVNVDFVQ